MESAVMQYTLYHGTPQCYVDNIINDGFAISTSETHWMGKGVYFYDDAHRAYSFVNKVRKDAIPAVLKAELEVEKHKILDLVNNAIDKEKFKQFIISQFAEDEHAIVLKDSDMADEKSRDKIIFKFKCALFDRYCIDNSNIELLICAHNTHPGCHMQILMKSLGIDHNIEVQYCAKVLNIIKNISLMEVES